MAPAGCRRELETIRHRDPPAFEHRGVAEQDEVIVRQLQERIELEDQLFGVDVLLDVPESLCLADEFDHEIDPLALGVLRRVVNGPGESKHAHLGISLPGTFEEPVAPVYMDGRLLTTLRGDAIVAEFLGILNDYVHRNFPPTRRTADSPASVAP